VPALLLFLAMLAISVTITVLAWTKSLNGRLQPAGEKQGASLATPPSQDSTHRPRSKVTERLEQLPAVVTPGMRSQDLLAKDFSAALDCLSDGQIYGELFDASQGKVSADQSAKERKMLYGVLLPDRNRAYLPTQEIEDFYYFNKRLPRSAYELARFSHPSFLSKEHIEQLATSEPAIQIGQLAPYINAITGHFIDTFEQKTWTPGGIYIQHLNPNPKPGDLHYKEVESKRKSGMVVSDSWLLRVYGDSPGEVLLEQPLYYYEESRPVAKPISPQR
jgi:hypothetical protein